MIVAGSNWFNGFQTGLGVRVYWNLHKHCYSVKYHNRVICHTDEIFLNVVTFKVSESSRQRVIKDQRKNVHAYVEGIVTVSAPDVSTFVEYDPYRHIGFVATGDLSGQVLTAADRIAMLTVNRHPVLIAANVR